MVKHPPAIQETWFDPWVGKIPQRWEWQLTPVFLPGKLHGQKRVLNRSWIYSSIFKDNCCQVGWDWPLLSDLGLAEASRFRPWCREHHFHPILVLLLTRNSLLASTRHWQPTPVFLPGESQGQRSLVAAIYGVTQSQTWLKRLSSSSSSSRHSYRVMASLTGVCNVRLS